MEMYFSVDFDELGVVKSHELKPGERASWLQRRTRRSTSSELNEGESVKLLL